MRTRAVQHGLSIRSDEIHTLITTLERYNGNIVPKLEAYQSNSVRALRKAQIMTGRPTQPFSNFYQSNPSQSNKTLDCQSSLLRHSWLSRWCPDFQLSIWVQAKLTKRAFHSGQGYQWNDRAEAVP